MPSRDYGAFTANVARRSQKGPPSLSENENTATDEYTVFLGDKHPNEVTISGLPKLGDSWDLAPSGETWICDQITWSNSFPNEYWVASVRYRNQDDEQTDDTEAIPSGVVLKKITYNPTAWNMDCEYDVGTGAPVRNSVGDRFQDALTKQVFTTSIIIDTKEDKVPTSDLALQGTINKTQEKIGGVTIAKHCGLLTIGIKQGDDPEYPFDVTRTIQVATNPLPKPASSGSSSGVASAPAPRDNPGGNYIITGPGAKTAVSSYGRDDLGFDACILNTGYRYSETEDGETNIKRFYDDDPEGGQVPAVDPHMLDENGEEATSGNTYWYVIQRYKDANWPQWYPKGAPKKKNTQPTSGSH